ncbi:MAG: hypothetical protein WD077_08125 [Bacteroidia bacterium]
MGTKDILREINKLPVVERIKVAEETLKSIRKNQMEERMEKAVETLMQDYQSDQDLTAFTAIDFDKFYEAR